MENATVTALPLTDNQPAALAASGSPPGAAFSETDNEPAPLAANNSNEAASDALDDLFWDVAEAAEDVYYHPAWRGATFQSHPKAKWRETMHDIVYYAGGLARAEPRSSWRTPERKEPFATVLAQLLEQIARMLERPELDAGVYNTFCEWQNELADWVVPNDRRRSVWNYRNLASTARAQGQRSSRNVA